MTRQLLENFIHSTGEALEMSSFPLEVYLRKKAKDFKMQVTCTNLWRCYLGTWQIKENRLYLVGFEAYRTVDGEEIKLGLSDLFPGQTESVFAEWFTGELTCPMGEAIPPYSMILTRREKTLCFEIKSGVLASEKLINNVVTTVNLQK